jgi:hypothetical protein
MHKQMIRKYKHQSWYKNTSSNYTQGHHIQVLPCWCATYDHKVSRTKARKYVELKYGRECNLHSCTDWQLRSLLSDMRQVYRHVFYWTVAIYRTRLHIACSCNEPASKAIAKYRGKKDHGGLIVLINNVILSQQCKKARPHLCWRSD